MPETSTGIYAYFAVFGALVLAAFGFPIPEEIPIVVAGGLCADAAKDAPHDAYSYLPGALGLPIPGLAGPAAAIAAVDAPNIPRPRRFRHPVWWIMLPVCIIGVVICDGLLYGIGRIGGPRLLEVGWVKKWIVRPETREKIEGNFHKYGVRILLGVRMLPGVRAPVFVMAGVLRLPLTRFLLADLLYAIVIVTILFTLAYWFTHQFQELITNITHKVDSLRPYFIVALIAGVGLFLVFEFWKRRRMTGDPKEVPIIGEVVVKPAGNDPFPESLVLPKPPPEQSEHKNDHPVKKKQTHPDRAV